MPGATAERGQPRPMPEGADPGHREAPQGAVDDLRPMGEPRALAREAIAAAEQAGVLLATAESLTGGALCSALVDVPGASAVVAGGAVCYRYDAKTRVLGVDAALLERTGAVTAEVARQMAVGALALYGADIAIATTGAAGPGPDDRGVPAGTVHLAAAIRGGCGAESEGAADELAVLARCLRLDGDRPGVRSGAVDAALELAVEAIALAAV